MVATIRIEQYPIHCVIGVHPHERESEQQILLDIDMTVDIAACVVSDALKDTVDYGEIVKVCEELARARRYHLLETFAHAAAHLLKKTFSPLAVRVSVHKKGAIPLAKTVSVEVVL